MDPAAPIQLPSENSDFNAFRDALVQQGYAVASSSWSDNGYAEKDAAQRTHQLSGAFAAAAGTPARTILVGKSLGGLSVLQLVEQFPSQYDGALIMCGPVGGSSVEIKYLADARILYDHFFPGGLPGNAFHPVLQDFAPGSPAFMNVYGSLFNGFFTPDQRTVQFALAAHLRQALRSRRRVGGLRAGRRRERVPAAAIATARRSRAFHALGRRARIGPS